MRPCVYLFLSAYALLAATPLSAKDLGFSQDRDLPPLRLAATDIDTVLQKTHSLIAAANVPFFLIRHAPEISFLALVVVLAGIPASYFLSRNER